ncbi:unnamed protein product [Linum tenue]|uniref:Cytochrome P450 704B1 n=1 Tax=Linum tenue TaxID=586396 RepID=A0AAV0IZJ5_9ROSI|nr:unnamed protein product [Linum tenue]
MEDERALLSMFLVVACFFVSWVFVHRWNQRNKKGPKTWPIVGAAIEQLMNFDRMHDWLVNYLSESRTVVVPMPSTTYTYIADPASVEHVLKTNFANYPKELFMRMTLDSICKVGFGVEIGTLAPNLPENQFAQAFDTANIIVTLRFIDPLWRIKKLFNAGSEALLDKSIKTINDFTYSVIRRRKTELEEEAQAPCKDNKVMKQDILSRFIELGKDPESKMTDKGLRDVVLNFVIAGRDTTATTLSWVVYMIMTHGHVAEKLYMELKTFENERANEENATLIQCDDVDDIELFNKRVMQYAGLLNYDSLGKLHYLHAVITETLRLYPAVPQDPKGILEDDVLPDGTKVKAGGMVTYVPYSMGRMEYNWGPDAALFKPERWLKDGLFQNSSPFKFTAFQAGPRICLGKDSAYLQMKMALAILCRFFKFNLVPNHPVQYRMMTILSMAHGLKLKTVRCL